MPLPDLFKKRHTCRICESLDLDLVVPLRPIPVATPNFSVSARPDHPVYREPIPLELYLCRHCGLLQCLVVINPKIQYVDYVYTTSRSLGLSDHFKQVADTVVDRLKSPPNSLAVEIGSNDGTLLSFFKARGFRVVGVDPARAIAERATAAGTPTLPTFFGAEVVERIKKTDGLAALIIANNVIANLDDLNELCSGVRNLLAPSGTFVFETQYGADVVFHNLFDTIYHEHLSYFCLKPLSHLFRRHGLRIVDVERISTKGGSIRVAVGHETSPIRPSPSITAMIAEEESRGLYMREIYARLVRDIAEVRDRLRDMVKAQRSANRSIAGYGVSVGTTTLLAQFGLESEIDFLVDDDPAKASVLRGPGYDIPVKPPISLVSASPGLVVIFAWRYVDSIVSKHGEYLAHGGKFVVPLPRVRLI